MFVILTTLGAFELTFAGSALLHPKAFIKLRGFVGLFRSRCFLATLLGSALCIVYMIPFVIVLPLVLTCLIGNGSHVVNFFHATFCVPIIVSTIIINVV